MNVERAKEIREMVEKYNIFLEYDKDRKPTGRIGINSPQKAVKDNAKPAIIAAKPEIIEYFIAETGDGIEGLKEIRAAVAEIEAYDRRFKKSFYGEYAAGGMGTGKRPTHDIEAMKAKYPRAAAYLKAENLSLKYNDDLSEIGRDAILEVVFGDYEKALADMDEKRKAFAERHIWD